MLVGRVDCRQRASAAEQIGLCTNNIVKVNMKINGEIVSRYNMDDEGTYEQGASKS
jgi:hypothetical protein